MNMDERKHKFRMVTYLFSALVVISSIGLMGLSPHPYPLRQEPTPRDTPTPEATWTTTPTFTSTPTETPVPTNTPSTPPPTNTSKPPTEPPDTPEPTSTDEATVTRTPTKTGTVTPGMVPVTPIISPVWVTSAPTYYYGTRLPISGVEPTPTPSMTPPPTLSPTPVPTLTWPPSPTITPTPTPSDRLGPGTPTGLVATAGNGVVVLEWTPNGEPDLEGYRLYRSAAQGTGYSKMVSVDKKLARYVDNTVTNDVTYYYVVTAFDTGSNESAFSKEVSIKPSAQKGMPASGATLPEIIAESPWTWMVILTATLLALVGFRRRNENDGSVIEAESDDSEDAAKAESDDSSEKLD